MGMGGKSGKSGAGAKPTKAAATAGLAAAAPRGAPSSMAAAGGSGDRSLPLDQQWMAAAKIGAVDELKRCHAEDASLLTKQARGIGHTALHWSAAAGHLTAVTWLLDAGCPVGVRNAGDSTPLHSAAGMGQVAVVEELLKRGAPTARMLPPACRRTPRRSCLLMPPRTVLSTAV